MVLAKFCVFFFLLSLPKSFGRAGCTKGGAKQVIKNDKSVFQENIHLAPGTECPCPKSPCRASLSSWQALPSNLRNLRKGENFKQKFSVKLIHLLLSKIVWGDVIGADSGAFYVSKRKPYPRLTVCVCMCVPKRI